MRQPLALTLLGLIALTTAADVIVTPEEDGSSTVEAATNLITTSCIFDDDKTFLRRLAYVESRDGKTSNTYRPGYHGGIWQVDENYFTMTKTSSLSSFHTAIQTSPAFAKYNIVWRNVSWRDLRKPLFSALAARLYFQYRYRNIPRKLDQQANMWKSYYRPAGNTQSFIDLSKTLEKHCNKSTADIMFVLDGSGSVSNSDFAKTKDFVKDFIKGFDIGLDKNRIGVIQFSSSSVTEFALNRYSRESDLISAVDRIRQQNGGTATHLALNMLVDRSFTTSGGARLDPNVAKVAIVVTDGMSNSQSMTITAAKRVHAKDITVFSVGVGRANEVELEAIASLPTCLHMFKLIGYDEIDSLRSAIEKRTCEAPIIITPPSGGEDSEIVMPLPPGGDQNCKLKIDKEGATIKLAADKGSIYFYLAKDSYPSEAYYDHKVVAVPGIRGVVFVPQQQSEFVFCNIKSNSSTEDNVTIDVDIGDEDHCKAVLCQNGGQCSDTGSGWKCLCDEDWTGTNCETQRNPCRNVRCKNGGTCVPKGNGWKCRCTSDWTGKYCQTLKDPCRNVNCRNGGTCVAKGTSWECQCATGWTGTYCGTSTCPIGYSCKKDCPHPCTKENMDKEDFFFGMASDKTKFIQCAPPSQCFEMSCQPGLVWVEKDKACNWP